MKLYLDVNNRCIMSEICPKLTSAADSRHNVHLVLKQSSPCTCLGLTCSTPALKLRSVWGAKVKSFHKYCIYLYSHHCFAVADLL